MEQIRRPDMDIRVLKYFLSVAKYKSFTHAAAHLYVSQPALSKAIRKLEVDLGAKLLVMRGHQMELTDCGRALMERAQPIVNEFDSLSDVVQDVLSLTTGIVRVGITPMIAVLYLAPVITEFCNRFPGIELKLFENGSYVIREQVSQGELDFGICIRDDRIDSKDQGLEEKILFQDEMCLLVHESNKLSTEKSIRFEQLAHERFNLYNAGYALKDAIFSRCCDAGFEPILNISSSKAHFLIKMAACGNGICLLPYPYAIQYKTSEISIIPFEPSFAWTGCLVTKKGRYISRASQALIDCIIGRISDMRCEENQLKC